MTTILYDDRDLKVEVFEKILKENYSIGLLFSGGVDSSFTLWWLAKCIDVSKLYDTHTILPITALEDKSSLPYNNIKEIRKIISIVKKDFPKVNILNHYTYKIKLGPTETKNEYNKKHKDMLLNSGIVDTVLSCVMAAPLFEDVDLGEAITQVRSLKKQLRKGDDYKYKSPFGLVDKKFIAYQYKKYNLLDTIFPLTRSCVWPSEDDGTPCKKCSWCFEKYWAYNMYDKCINTPEPDWIRAKNWYH